MSIEAVRAYLKQWDLDKKIMEFTTSSATVELAAQALGVIPARIAKTLSFKLNDECILIVAAGDVKVDNQKYKAEFSQKAKMMTAEEVLEFTGHAVGGVCPFGLANGDIKVYADVSMKRFDTLFPACGSSNSAIELTCDEIIKYANVTKWVDVCKGWE